MMKILVKNRKSEVIYMDFAATSPMRREVIKAMEPFCGDKFGNPSSIHSVGRMAKSALDEARNTIANIIGASEQEVYFTSGGTEGNNLAILGLARNVKCQISNVKSNPNDKIIKPTTNYQLPTTNVSKGHFITTQIEHQAVLRTFQRLEKEGFEVTYLPVDKDGLITAEQVATAIRPETLLVSIIYVSNEIGTVQPIREIGKLIKKINEKSLNKIYFHTDAVQAPEYFCLNVLKQNVDLMSLSAHKFGGPKGVGLLYVSRNVSILPIIFGGEQELALRPGTENVAGAVAMAKALEIATGDRHRGNEKKVSELRDYFEKRISDEIDGIYVLAQGVKRSPGIAAIAFGHIDPVTLVMNLDLEGICVSSGAACSSGSVEMSHVMEALHLEKPFDRGAVRFCFNASLSREKIEIVVGLTKNIVKRMKAKTNHIP